MVNKDILLQTYNLQVDERVIFQSDSKLILSGLILSGKSNELDGVPVALKFSRLDEEIIGSYISNFEEIIKFNGQPNKINHYSIHKLDRSVSDFDVLEVLELVDIAGADKIKKDGIPLSSLKLMISDLLESFRLLHKNGILHRDIKPSNILVCKIKEAYQFKIIDFDLMGNSDNQKLFTTPEFLAPEVNSFSDYTIKSEIWSIGLTLYLIFAEELPYSTRQDQLSIKEVRQNVLNAEFDFFKVPTPLRIPLSLCLKKNPNERIGDLGVLILIIDPIYFVKSSLKKVFSKL